MFGAAPAWPGRATAAEAGGGCRVNRSLDAHPKPSVLGTELTSRSDVDMRSNSWVQMNERQGWPGPWARLYAA